MCGVRNERPSSDSGAWWWAQLRRVLHSNDGLVVDLARMAAVSVTGTRAVVGAGARLIDVYAGIAGAGRMLAGGSCPTVGIAGLTLGGGVGVLTRRFGLTCDQLISARVVTADGKIRWYPRTPSPTCSGRYAG